MNRQEQPNQKLVNLKELRRQSRLATPHVENMEARELLAAPAMDALSQISVPSGKSLFVPLSSTTSDQSSVSYSVTSSDQSIKSTVLSGGTYVKMTVSGYGDLTFKLFDTLTPESVGKIKTLVQQGFYNGLSFHRVIKNFMVQGGDPVGNGTGGAGFSFADEFNSKAIFSGTGQLALANSGKDTNSSQFFVTTGPQRALDFNHSIIGQLVKGFDVLDKIQNVPTSQTSAPTLPVVISKAEVVQDTTDAVLLIEAPASLSTSQLTITATAADGESSQQSVPVNVVQDTVNDPPFMGALTDLSTRVNTPLKFTLTATDLENDTIDSSVVATTNADKVTITTNGAEVTITPKTGFVGTVQLIAGVRQNGATARGSTPNPWDTQAITLTVSPPPVTVTAMINQVMEGQSSGDRVVASFADADNPTATAASYGATIEWGDSTASVGTIRPRVGGGFEVVGSHNYNNEGTYTTRVNVGEPAVDGSAGVVKGTAVGQFIATDAPLVAKGTSPAGVVANQSWSGIIATFTDTSPASPVSDYSAIIRWGDGSIEKSVSIARNTAGQIEVTGEHTYLTAGRKVVQVLIRDKGTSSTTAVTPIVVGASNGITPQPAPKPVTTPTTTPAVPVTPPPVATAAPSANGALDPQTSGRLAAVSDSGSSSTDSITNISAPVFEGQSAPGSSVTLVAKPVSGSGQSINLGSATVGDNGSWSVKSASALADGQYVVTITVTRGTETLTKTLLGGGAGTGSPLIIDTIAPQVTQLGYNKVTGQVRVNAQDSGSGLSSATWSNSANYQIIATAGRNAGQQINSATLRMVSATSYPEATYNLILDRRSGPRPQSVQVTLKTSSLTDQAGNAATGVTSQILGTSKIIKQLPKGVARTIQNSRTDTSVTNKILNFILPTGLRSKRF